MVKVFIACMTMNADASPSTVGDARRGVLTLLATLAFKLQANHSQPVPVLVVLIVPVCLWNCGQNYRAQPERRNRSAGMEDESSYIDIYGKSLRQDKGCWQWFPSTLLPLHALNHRSRFTFHHEHTQRKRRDPEWDAFDSGTGIIVGV